MDSGIQEFFKNKTVFLTGGSGFLGKVVIEKLLRTTEVKRMYLLIRSKRGVPIEERTSVWATDPIFELLLKDQPLALQRIYPIAGDCLEPELGISDVNRKLLVSEVQVIIHGAATVRFDEALHLALIINVRAAQLMLHLAREMTQLVSFVHISTAYSNCVATDIDERFYPEHLKDSSDQILALSELLSAETIDSMTTSLLGAFPNTYIYTKALGEDLIRREAGDLPLCIFRPAIVMPIYRDPLVGWVDNLFGPITLMYGIAQGMVRVLMTDPNVRAGLVPVDFCCNLTLACAWKTGVNTEKGAKKDSPPIYTLAPTPTNQITYRYLMDMLLVNRDITPMSKMLWYPYVLFISPPLFPLAAFFYHTIPGYLFDKWLRLMGRKPIMAKVYEKIHKNIGVLRLFCFTSFNFGMTNTQQLYETMTKKDQSVYDFNMVSIDWNWYLRRCIDGIRLYIAKDPLTPESLAKALKLKDRLKYLHYAVSLSLGTAGGFIIWTLAKLLI